MTFLLNALVVVGAIILSVLLIMLVKLVRPSHQAQPQPETDLELGALPAATILVTSNSHVWAKQEVSQVSHSQVSVDSKNQTSSQSSGGGVFQAEPGSSEESDQGRLHSPTSTGIAVLPGAGTLQCNAFEEVKLSSKEESATSILTQVPNQEISSGVNAFQGEVGTSEEDFDECQPRSPKGAGIAALPSNLQSSTLEAEATESSPSVDQNATSILTPEALPAEKNLSAAEAEARKEEMEHAMLIFQQISAAPVGNQRFIASGFELSDANAFVMFAVERYLEATSWTEYHDPETGRSYYHNEITQETTWEKPPPCELQTSDPEESM